MDGTLVDSMPIWKSLGKDYLEARGHHPTQAQLAAMGPMTMLEGAAFLIETFGVEGPPERIIDEMHAVMEAHYRTDIPLKAGIQDYLAQLKQQGAKLCVATATAEPLARACLERLGVAHHFDFILSCEAVGKGKTSQTSIWRQPAVWEVPQGIPPSLRMLFTPHKRRKKLDFTPLECRRRPMNRIGPPWLLWRTRPSWIGGRRYDGNTTVV